MGRIANACERFWKGTNKELPYLPRVPAATLVMPRFPEARSWTPWVASGPIQDCCWRFEDKLRQRTSPHLAYRKAPWNISYWLIGVRFEIHSFDAVTHRPRRATSSPTHGNKEGRNLWAVSRGRMDYCFDSCIDLAAFWLMCRRLSPEIPRPKSTQDSRTLLKNNINHQKILNTKTCYYRVLCI